MSNNKDKSDKRVQDLLAFSMGIMSGENGKMLIEKHQEAIDNVTLTICLPLKTSRCRWAYLQI